MNNTTYAFDRLDSTDSFDVSQDFVECLLSFNQGSLVIIRAPLATPFTSHGVEFDTFRNCGADSSRRTADGGRCDKGLSFNRRIRKKHSNIRIVFFQNILFTQNVLTCKRSFRMKYHFSRKDKNKDDHALTEAVDARKAAAMEIFILMLFQRIE